MKENKRQSIKRYYAKMYNNYIAFIPDKEIPKAHATAMALEQWYEIGITEADAIFEEADDDLSIKQIPRKPLLEHKNYHCPICKDWIMWGDAIPNENDNYCGRCGQKFDWKVDK